MNQRDLGSALWVKWCFFCFLLLGYVLAGWLSPKLVYADGGAPNLAYVAGAGQGVGIIDIAQQRATHTFAIAGRPYMLLLSPDGGLLYVTQPGAGRVVALAAKTGQTICQAAYPGHPALLALSADSSVIYVAGLDEETILVFNAQTCAQEQSFQAPEPVHWMATTLSNAASDAPRTQLWIAGKNSVDILDDQGAVLDRIAVPGNPQYLSVPGALTAYVTTQQGSVIAIDMLAHRIIATLLTGGSFGAIDYNAVTGEIYVPDQRLKRIDVLAPVLAGMALLPHEPSYFLPVSASPQAVAITNDGQLGFVALANGQVVMMDIPGRNTLKTIAVGGSPLFIITGAYPPAAVPLPVSSETSPLARLLPGLIVVVVACLGLVGGYFWFVRRRKGSAFSRTNVPKT